MTSKERFPEKTPARNTKNLYIFDVRNVSLKKSNTIIVTSFDILSELLSKKLTTYNRKKVEEET